MMDNLSRSIWSLYGERSPIVKPIYTFAAQVAWHERRLCHSTAIVLPNKIDLLD